MTNFNEQLDNLYGRLCMEIDFKATCAIVAQYYKDIPLIDLDVKYRSYDDFRAIKTIPHGLSQHTQDFIKIQEELKQWLYNTKPLAGFLLEVLNKTHDRLISKTPTTLHYHCKDNYDL